jgi:hypothetical protein
MTGWTLRDLDDARTRLDRALKEAFERCAPDPPKAMRTRIDDARNEIRSIERELKRAGIIPTTSHELLEGELDSAFPDAAGGEVVLHKGKRYQRRFFAVRKSARGKVQEWGRVWESVPSA